MDPRGAVIPDLLTWAATGKGKSRDVLAANTPSKPWGLAELFDRARKGGKIKASVKPLGSLDELKEGVTIKKHPRLYASRFGSNERCDA